MTEAEIRAMTYEELSRHILARNNYIAALDRANELDNNMIRVAGWLLDLREAVDHTGG